MADHRDTSGGTPGVMQEFLAQLRGVTERLEGLVAHTPLPTVPGLASLPGLRNLPAPGALSAAQLNAIATSVAAQRRSIEALKTQLTAFDEQLAVLQRILGPLTEWSAKWAQVEERVMRARHEPGAGEQVGGP